MTDLLLKGDAHNGGLKGVKAIAALELSRLLFDFNKDPYSLYAVKLVSSLYISIFVFLAAILKRLVV